MTRHPGAALGRGDHNVPTVGGPVHPAPSHSLLCIASPGSLSDTQKLRLHPGHLTWKLRFHLMPEEPSH